ncbi:MAG: hypothetical protein ACYDHO_08075 [Gaiellaceae bacterium]
MSDQGGEGQVPEPPGLEGRGELPPRPTVRESFRRGLFVRLPSEGDAEEGVAGAGQAAESGAGIADQYPEQVADPYPGWRQAADGSWEAVGPEAYEGSESAEAAPPAPYPEIDQSANFASVAGGEPFIHEEESVEAPSWAFTPPEQEVALAGADAVVPVTPQTPEIVSGVMPEIEPEPSAEAPVEVEAPAPEMPTQPEPAAEVVAEEAAAYPPEVEPEAAAAVETAPLAPEPAAPAEAAPTAAAAADDPVAATGVYIPTDVELLEGDMPLYGEQEVVPPRFAGSGLGEPCFIEFADLGETLAGLRRLLPKGTRLTYNYDFERAWIRSSEGIDLSSFVERIGAAATEGDAASS